MNKIYGYARVSAKDQNLDRQIVDLQKADNTIYIYIQTRKAEKTLKEKATSNC